MINVFNPRNNAISLFADIRVNGRRAFRTGASDHQRVRLAFIEDAKRAHTLNCRLIYMHAEPLHPHIVTDPRAAGIIKLNPILVEAREFNPRPLPTL